MLEGLSVVVDLYGRQTGREGEDVFCVAAVMLEILLLPLEYHEVLILMPSRFTNLRPCLQFSSLHANSNVVTSDFAN